MPGSHGEKVPPFPLGDLAAAIEHNAVYHGLTFTPVSPMDPRVAENVKRQGVRTTPAFVARLIELANQHDVQKQHDEHHYRVGIGKAHMPRPHWHTSK